MDFSAKEFISKFFDQYSQNLMGIIQSNEIMTLNGFPGLVLALCAVTEIIYIIMDQMQGKAVLMRTAKLMLYISITLAVFGSLNYSSLGLTNALPAHKRPTGKSDLLRDTHAYFRYYFDYIGNALTEGASSDDGQPPKAKSVTEIVQTAGMARSLCDTQVDEGAKLACVKGKMAMSLADLEKEWNESSQCTMFPESACKVFSTISKYLSFENIFLLITQLLYVVRFVGYLIILFGYIMTVVMTYLTLKLLFPFIVMEKTRSHIISGVRFYLSTTAIVAVLGFLEYVSTIAVSSLLITTGNSMGNWGEFTFNFILTMILTIIIFGVEIALYFKVPELTKNIFDLNIASFVEISRTAQDGLKLGLQMLGVGTQGATFGAMTGMAKLFNFTKKASEVTGAGGGVGPAPSDISNAGGGSSGSSGPSNSNFSSGGGGQSRPENRNDDTGFYAGRQNINNQGGPSYNRPAPSSEVNQEDLEKLGANRKKNSSEKAEGQDETSSKSKESTDPKKESADQGASATGAKVDRENARPANASTGGKTGPTVDAGLLGKLRSAKSKMVNVKESVADKLETNALGRFSKRVGGMAGEAVKAAPTVLKTAGTVALQAAAGDLGGAFQTTLKSADQFSKGAKDGYQNVVSENTKKFFTTSGANSNELHTEEFEGIETLKDVSEYKKLNNEISSLKDEITEMEAKEGTMATWQAGGRHTQEEIDAFRSRLDGIKSELETKQQLQEKLEEDYQSQKSLLIERLMSNKAKLSEADQLKLVNLFQSEDEFTSDTIKNILKNPDKKVAPAIVELKNKSDAAVKSMRSMIENDIKKYGRITSITEKQLKSHRKLIPNKVIDELIKLANKRK